MSFLQGLKGIIFPHLRLEILSGNVSRSSQRQIVRYHYHDKGCCARQWQQQQRFATTTTTKTTTMTKKTTAISSIAIARHVPRSFANAITKFSTSPSSIDLDKAIRQHEMYVSKLRKFVPTLCLPPQDDLADSCFVEDTVVAVGMKAVITNPGHPSRRGEVDSMRTVLFEQLGMDVFDMCEESQGNAFCDGGDVLYTSRHLFVGLSERTNKEAIQVLQDVFGMEAIAVPFDGNALHLKSIVTHIDDSTLLVPEGSLGDAVLAQMDAKERGYTVVRLPSMLACNVVSVNGGLLAQDVGCSTSKSRLESVASERHLEIDFVNCSEFAKVDGALTCCSVLLNI
jgi:dimethylargininase